MDNNCIFCKIIAGEIPSTKVFESEKVLAILDINPVNPGHILVLPKVHVPNFEEISEADLVEVIKAVKIIGRAIKTGIGCPGYNINVNNDPIAGQIIPHLHFHIIPRLEGDGLKLWPQTQYKDQSEIVDIAKKIGAAI